MTVAHTPTGMHEFSARTDDERRVASDLDRILARISDGQADIRISIHPTGEPGEAIPISSEQFRLLAHIVGELARGHGVSLIPMDAELTTTEAARQLKVSRPFLVGLLQKGEIPYRTVGTHRRIRFRDLWAYKQRNDRKRLEALEELSALDQEYGLE
jgi:excisionase family DNA binding protein